MMKNFFQNKITVWISKK